MSKNEDEPRELTLAQEAIERVFRPQRLSIETFQDEVRSIAKMAAINGDFKSAVAGMDLLGKSLNAFDNVKTTEQHLHVHTTEIKELPPEELRQRIAQLRSVHAHVDTDD